MTFSLHEITFNKITFNKVSSKKYQRSPYKGTHYSKDITMKSEISALFDTWNSALQTRDPKQVVALYETNAILLPTVSNQVRHNHAEIEDYFVSFLEKEPMGKIDESNVRTFGNIAINSGVYTFTFKGGATVQARFTYVYRWNGQEWKIIEHHSSQMPES